MNVAMNYMLAMRCCFKNVYVLHMHNILNFLLFENTRLITSMLCSINEVQINLNAPEFNRF